MSELFAFQVAQEVPVQQWVADGTPMATEVPGTFRPALTGCAIVRTPFLDGPIDFPTDVINLG